MKHLILITTLFYASAAHAELSGHVNAVYSVANRVSAFGTESMRVGAQVEDQQIGETLRNLGDDAYELEDDLLDVVEKLQVNQDYVGAKSDLQSLSSRVSNLDSAVRNLWGDEYQHLKRLGDHVETAYNRARGVFDRPEPPPWNRQYSLTARRYTHSESFQDVESQQLRTLARDKQQCEATGATHVESAGEISCEQKTVCVRGLFRCREWRVVFDCEAAATSQCRF